MRMIECPECGEMNGIDEDDTLIICEECGEWLAIDEGGEAYIGIL